MLTGAPLYTTGAVRPAGDDIQQPFVLAAPWRTSSCLTGGSAMQVCLTLEGEGRHGWAGRESHANMQEDAQFHFVSVLPRRSEVKVLHTPFISTASDVCAQTYTRARTHTNTLAQTQTADGMESVWQHGAVRI